MALREDIKTEIDAALTVEAKKAEGAPGWWQNINYVFDGPSVVGYVVTLGNMDGFVFTFAQRTETLSGEIDELAKSFSVDVAIEVRERRIALSKG